MKIDVRIDYAEREVDGMARVSVAVPELGVEPIVDVNFKRLFERCGVPDAPALDLLLVASACYVIDKTVPRSNTHDNWTREFEVSVPVTSPRLWHGVTDDLQAALRFLTGDVWKLSFHASKSELFQQPARGRHRQPSTPVFPVGETNAVCLFSGGLDSLAGAIDLLATEDSKRVMLVGHYDSPGPRKQQNDLLDRIRVEVPRTGRHTASAGRPQATSCG